MFDNRSVTIYIKLKENAYIIKNDKKLTYFI